MIALAWSFFVVLSMVMASSQAFLTAPLPGAGYAQGLASSNHSISSGSGLDPSTQESPSPLRGHAAEAIVPQDEGEEDEKEEDRSSSNSSSSSSNSNEDEDEDDEDEDEDEVARRDYGLQHRSVAGGTKRRNDEQTVYVIEFETEADGTKGESHRNRKDMSDDGSGGQSPLDPWSIVWYIGSFGGLVAFFLIVSCSEWCCRRGARPLSVPYTQRGEVINPNGQPVSESPPPPYHLFAPPPYDSVNYAEIADKSGAGEKLDIYVITVPIAQAAVLPPAQLQVQVQQQQQPPPA